MTDALNISNKLSVFVSGNPAPQGSKSWLGGKVMVESCKRLQPWRADVREALLKDGVPKANFGKEPVVLCLEFIMPRVLSTPKKYLPPHTKKPDLSKLIRAVEDAITSAGVWYDDCQVVEIAAKKRIALIGETSGCQIVIERRMNENDRENYAANIRRQCIKAG